MANELKFQRLRRKNRKNFQALDIEIQNRMFLVGANAVGKPNLLDVFRFPRDLAPPGGGFGEARGFPNPRCASVSESPCAPSRPG